VSPYCATVHSRPQAAQVPLILSVFSDERNGFYFLVESGFLDFESLLSCLCLIFSSSVCDTFSLKQGETFVPESIVRFGKRTEGRDGVVTIKAEDERIKYALFLLSLISI